MATFVVNGGKGITTGRLRAVGTEPLNIGWGTGAGTAAATDTTLFTEALVTLAAGTTDHTAGTTAKTDSTLFTEALVTLAAGTTDHTAGTSTRITTTTTNDSFRVTGTRTATGAGTVTNAGLWDAASGGNLFLKGDFTGIGLANGDSVAFTITCVLAN